MLQVIYYTIEHKKSKRVCYTNRNLKRAEAMLKKLEAGQWDIKKFDIVSKKFIG